MLQISGLSYFPSPQNFILAITAGILSATTGRNDVDRYANKTDQIWVAKCVPKKFPAPLQHHHHQPAALVQGRTDPYINAKYLKLGFIKQSNVLQLSFACFGAHTHCRPSY